MSIGQRIQQLRTQHHFTQQQLAQELHVTRQTISKWENDMSLPDMDMMLHICQYFEVELNDLLGIEKEKIDEVTLNDIYSHMTHYQDHLKKENKKKYYINSLLIVLTVISLCLSLFMFNKIKKYDDMFNQYLSLQSQINERHSYSIHSFEENDAFINSYSQTYMEIENIDFTNNKVYVKYQFTLSQYNEKTTVSIQLSNNHSNQSMIFPLTKEKDNVFVFKKDIPIDNYETTLIIQDDTTSHKEILLQDENKISSTNYLSYIVIQMISLKIPVDEKGNLILDQIVYEPLDIHQEKTGYFNIGKLTVEISSDKMNYYASTSLKEKTIMKLHDQLPINENLSIKISYTITFDDKGVTKLGLSDKNIQISQKNNKEYIIY